VFSVRFSASGGSFRIRYVIGQLQQGFIIYPCWGVGIAREVGMLFRNQLAGVGGVSVQPFSGRNVVGYRPGGSGRVGGSPVAFAVIFIARLVARPEGVILWQYQADKGEVFGSRVDAGGLQPFNVWV
jgi:hypothetical protein